jgi:hypothetical protein
LFDNSYFFPELISAKLQGLQHEPAILWQAYVRLVVPNIRIMSMSTGHYNQTCFEIFCDAMHVFC